MVDTDLDSLISKVSTVKFFIDFLSRSEELLNPPGLMCKCEIPVVYYTHSPLADRS